MPIEPKIANGYVKNLNGQIENQSVWKKETKGQNGKKEEQYKSGMTD